MPPSLRHGRLEALYHNTEISRQSRSGFDSHHLLRNLLSIPLSSSIHHNDSLFNYKTKGKPIPLLLRRYHTRSTVLELLDHGPLTNWLITGLPPPRRRLLIGPRNHPHPENADVAKNRRRRIRRNGGIGAEGRRRKFKQGGWRPRLPKGSCRKGRGGQWNARNCCWGEGYGREK